jgi:hypothetical protein
MTQAAITGIAPFFIVKNVPATLSFYRDRRGFEIEFQGPSEDDIFFGIVRRTIRETAGKGSPAGTLTFMSQTRMRWRRNFRRAMSCFLDHSKTVMGVMMVYECLKYRMLMVMCYSSGGLSERVI